ncbi:MAG TPA: sigma 54-interacting transcriptional regulator, partial [Polyangiales bacterium]
SEGQPTVAERPERWRDLVRASRRLFAETREPRVVARVCELALELVHAERALVIGFDASGEPRVLSRRELAGEARGLGYSRSVLERVALDGRPLLTVEAANDVRLERAESVAALHVRSVLCAELSGLSGRAFLYLDDRLRPSAFGASDLALVEDLLELARQALQSAERQTREARRARRAELSQRRLSRELARGLAEPHKSELIGQSAVLQRVLASARRIARSDAPVLITGESGTGKELLARYLHDESPRRSRAFVAENCAALPDSLLESALFGHVRGAFTGADRARRGLFEVADGGTLFLDEVGEMSPLLQGKLLRVLQEGELRPLGSERTREVDVRVIGATRRNLRELVQTGAFREDLFYRLAVVTLELPALRERREDIPGLVAHFLDKHGEGRRIHPTALRALELRDWPGNVRELENELRRALALSDGELLVEHLTRGDASELSAPPSELDLHAHTERLTRKLVRDALALAEGNVTRAAALLGVSRFGLQKILKRLQLPAK